MSGKGVGGEPPRAPPCGVVGWQDPDGGIRRKSGRGEHAGFGALPIVTGRARTPRDLHSDGSDEPRRVRSVHGPDPSGGARAGASGGSSAAGSSRVDTRTIVRGSVTSVSSRRRVWLSGHIRTSTPKRRTSSSRQASHRRGRGISCSGSGRSGRRHCSRQDAGGDTSSLAGGYGTRAWSEAPGANVPCRVTRSRGGRGTSLPAARSRPTDRTRSAWLRPSPAIRSDGRRHRCGYGRAAPTRRSAPRCAVRRCRGT